MLLQDLLLMAHVLVHRMLFPCVIVLICVVMLALRYAVSASGNFSATISSRNALAIHIGAISSSATPTSASSSPTSTGGSGTVAVNFAETATTVFGDVRGTIARWTHL